MLAKVYGKGWLWGEPRGPRFLGSSRLHHASFCISSLPLTFSLSFPVSFFTHPLCLSPFLYLFFSLQPVSCSPQLILSRSDIFSPPLWPVLSLSLLSLPPSLYSTVRFYSSLSNYALQYPSDILAFDPMA